MKLLFKNQEIDVEVGDVIKCQIEGTIIDVSNAHGACIKVELSQEDFTSPRDIWLDEKDDILISKV